MSPLLTVLIWLVRIGGVFVGMSTAYWVYRAWAAGGTPNGAPWSVLTMVGLSLLLITTPRADDRRFPRARLALTIVVILLAVLSLLL